MAIAVAGTLIAQNPVRAASDGSMGASSNGSVVINANVPNLVKITDLVDMTVNFTGTTTAQTDSVCVFSNTGNYTVTATSNEGSFTLNGVVVPDTIGYSVEWAATGGAGSGTTLGYNAISAAQSTSGANPACGGGLNATLIIRISDTDVGSAPADDYTGTLLLVVAPN